MTIRICEAGYGRHCRDCEVAPVCAVQPAEAKEVATMQDSAKQLRQELVSHESVKRAIERIRQVVNALLAAQSGSVEQFMFACRVRWECRLATQIALHNGYPAHKLSQAEPVIPARVDIAIGTVHQALRNLETAWSGQTEAAVGEALAEVVRCADELVDIYQVKGFDVGPMMARMARMAEEEASAT